MRKFIVKCGVFFLAVYTVIVSLNYRIDPANLFHVSIVEKMVPLLNAGKTIESPGNLDEGLFKLGMIKHMQWEPGTVVIGSSHIMYEPWTFEDCFVAGLSGAYLGDYYAVVGMLEEYKRLPQHIVIGADPWAFMTGAESGRHKSIREYALRALDRVDGKKSDVAVSNQSILDKYKELISFAYFQASCKKMRSNGLKKSLLEDNREIIVAENNEIGDKTRIMPNGRYIFSKNDFNSVHDNNNSADAAVRNQQIYQLGAGFSDLQTDNLAQFEKLIIYLQKKGVKIDFYLHPWYPSVYKHFCENEKYSGVLKTEEYLRDLGKKYNIVVHGSFSSDLTGMKEEDFADWFHLKADKMMECYNMVLH